MLLLSIILSSLTTVAALLLLAIYANRKIMEEEDKESERRDFNDVYDSLKLQYAETKSKPKRKRGVNARKGDLVTEDESVEAAKEAISLMSTEGVSGLARKTKISRKKLHRIKSGVLSGERIPRLREKEVENIKKVYSQNLPF